MTQSMSMAWKVNDGVEIDVIIKIVTDVIGINWKHLARQLNFSETDIDSIEYDNRHNLKEQIAQLFIQWKRREGPLETTSQALVKGLQKANLQLILKDLERKDKISNLQPVQESPSLHIGGNIQPVQDSPSLHTGGNIQPVQESTSLHVGGNVHPVQEYPSPPIIPKLIGVEDEDEDTEIDKVIKGTLSRPVPLSPMEEQRHRIRMKRLIRMESDRTGQERFEEGDMIKVDKLGYGVIRWIGDIAGKLSAGIEFDERVVKAGGHDGSLKDISYFSCDRGHGLYLPYEILKRDHRFSSEKPNDMNSDTLNTSGNLGETVFNIGCGNDSVDSDKYSRSKIVDNEKVLDFCGKTHTQLFKEEPEEPADAPSRQMNKFYIPEDRVGLVIGKDGKNILDVERRTNTIIKISNTQSTSGRVTGIIIGSEENCQKAALMILEKLNRRVAMHTAASSTIEVPDSMVGRIIGKKGATINAIKSLSGAQDIEFSHKPQSLETFLNPKQECTITGTAEEIEKAKELIQQIVDGEDIVTSAKLAAILVKLGVISLSDDESDSSDNCVMS